jgi:SAM-dependent methyltransferase
MSAKVHEVFEAKTPQEMAARYDEWASSYEDDLGDHGGPREAADAMLQYAGPDSRILDAGCGTGLVGQLLAERGFRNIEGLDMSPGMLQRAASKGCYKALHQRVLGQPLDFETGSYDAVISVGVFVRAHAPSSSFDELARIVRPGGKVIFTMRPEFCMASDFNDKIAQLAESGRWRVVETSEPFSGRYTEFPEVNLQVWVCEVLAPAE